ncbi:MAG TPA: phosphoribosyltransferase family protein [Dehalococcoidales bacterium]|nr:phosphoribosyltransferase family protein [Dehalococcoidales bacterium]
MSMNRPEVIFENRQDAGRHLALRLMEYAGQPVVVLAVPNGGVPVALEVASALKVELDLIVCRKIPIPLTPEAGLGAIADDGTIMLNEELVKRLGLSKQQIDDVASKVRLEVKQRSLLYRGDRPLARVFGKIAIIIDDGLASGYTMMAAVASVRHRQPREIIVAVPCASAAALKQLEKRADRVVTVTTGYTPHFAVADFYHYWYDRKDEDVVRLLNQWRMRNFPQPKPPRKEEGREEDTGGY